MSSAARKRMGSTYNRYTGDAGFRRATFTRRAEFYRRDLHQGCAIRGHHVRWRRHVQRGYLHQRRQVREGTSEHLDWCAPDVADRLDSVEDTFNTTR
jgi:hypothetical protein